MQGAAAARVLPQPPPPPPRSPASGVPPQGGLLPGGSGGGAGAGAAGALPSPFCTTVLAPKLEVGALENLQRAPEAPLAPLLSQTAAGGQACGGETWCDRTLAGALRLTLCTDGTTLTSWQQTT